MSRPKPVFFFRQSLKSESLYSDEIINVLLLRPLAAILVWLIYPLPITPNHVTMGSIAIGMFAGYVYTLGTEPLIAVAGIMVTLKDILDDADGQLARAKNLYSRRGRFLDSVGDFVVSACVFAGVTVAVYQSNPGLGTILLGFLSLAGTTLRVSHHVFYQSSFLHIEQHYALNRITETISEEDRKGDPVALRLQYLFQMIYGWQDRLMYRIDQWCQGKNLDRRLLTVWYSDRMALRLTGLMGFGTEFALLTIFSIADNLETYLMVNVLLMNGVWLASILYRKLFLAKNLK